MGKVQVLASTVDALEGEHWISGVRMRIFRGWGGAPWSDRWILRGRDEGREPGARSAAGDRQRGLSVEKAGAESCEHMQPATQPSLVGQLTVFLSVQPVTPLEGAGGARRELPPPTAGFERFKSLLPEVSMV